MKLLVDAHVFDGKFQGTRTYLQGIYSCMIKHKDIDFYFAANNVSKLKDVFGESENIHYIHINTTNHIKRLGYVYSKIIKDNHIDYAHFQYISPLKKYCKEIITIHDLLFLDYPQYFPLLYRLKNYLLFKRSAKRADLLLTVSEYSRSEIINHYGIDKKKIHITPNGVLPCKIELLPDIKQKYNLEKYILTVSRIEPRKNQQMLLKAYVDLELWKQNYKLVIVGVKDIENKEFNELFVNLPQNIKDAILIIQASFDELQSLYKYANLFVFPSFAEGFGIPPIEAIMAGCNVLCSNETAMSDFGFLGDNLFSPYNLDELKAKMYKILFSNRIQKSNDYIDIVKNKYNWETISENLYQLICKQ